MIIICMMMMYEVDDEVIMILCDGTKRLLGEKLKVGLVIGGEMRRGRRGE